MGEALASLVLIVLVVSGVAFIFKPESGKRLLTSAVVLVVGLIVLGPFVACLINSIASSATFTVSRAPSPSGGGTVFLLFMFVLVAVAVVRFVLRRRQLRKLLGEPRLSLKKRLDSEGA